MTQRLAEACSTAASLDPSRSWMSKNCVPRRLKKNPVFRSNPVPRETRKAHRSNPIGPTKCPRFPISLRRLPWRNSSMSPNRTQLLQRKMYPQRPARVRVTAVISPTPTLKRRIKPLQRILLRQMRRRHQARPQEPPAPNRMAIAEVDA